MTLLHYLFLTWETSSAIMKPLESQSVDMKSPLPSPRHALATPRYATLHYMVAISL